MKSIINAVRQCCKGERNTHLIVRRRVRADRLCVSDSGPEIGFHAPRGSVGGKTPASPVAGLPTPLNETPQDPGMSPSPCVPAARRSSEP